MVESTGSFMIDPKLSPSDVIANTRDTEPLYETLKISPDFPIGSHDRL